jgi:hypothetical protein
MNPPPGFGARPNQQVNLADARQVVQKLFDHRFGKKAGRAGKEDVFPRKEFADGKERTVWFGFSHRGSAAFQHFSARGIIGGTVFMSSRVPRWRGWRGAAETGAGQFRCRL